MTYDATQNNKNKNLIDQKEEEFTREMIEVTDRATKKYSLMEMLWIVRRMHLGTHICKVF